jgi:outer membrane murein-binding lipoprotein Lpp
MDPEKFRELLLLIDEKIRRLESRVRGLECRVDQLEGKEESAG